MRRRSLTESQKENLADQETQGIKIHQKVSVVMVIVVTAVVAVMKMMTLIEISRRL